MPAAGFPTPNLPGTTTPEFNLMFAAWCDNCENTPRGRRPEAAKTSGAGGRRWSGAERWRKTLLDLFRFSANWGESQPPFSRRRNDSLFLACQDESNEPA